jgi:hypothetical protein
MLALLLALAIPAASAACPQTPELRDPDNQLTILEQNLKFIVVGSHRAERAGILRTYLETEGEEVDLLLLSEARLTSDLAAWGTGWCFYTQTGNGLADDGYSWSAIETSTSPGGLAIGVRERATGTVRRVTGGGRRFRARAVSLAEGVLGMLGNYRKGWASLTIDGTHIVWSHTQASYRQRPERGAGRAGRGRAGQFDDLADDLGHPLHATLITGDLNLLAGFKPRLAGDDARVARARDIDSGTVKAFRNRTGVDLEWFANAGTFMGSVFKAPQPPEWDTDAAYDRVGVNAAFLSRHPGTHVAPVEIGDEHMRVSDHLGLRITIPFADPMDHPGTSGAQRTGTNRLDAPW